MTTGHFGKYNENEWDEAECIICGQSTYKKYGKKVKGKYYCPLCYEKIKGFTIPYGCTYTNRFGDRILIGIFNSVTQVKSFKADRELLDKKSTDFKNIKDHNPRIVIWTTDIINKYKYVYTLRPDGSSHVIKEPDDDFIPDNWEMM